MHPSETRYRKSGSKLRIRTLDSWSGEILSVYDYTHQKTLQLVAIVDLHFHIYKNIPNGISRWGKSKPVRLIDAMNMTIDLPIELCGTHDVRPTSVVCPVIE